MWEKPMWERVASLETNIPNIMKEIGEIKKTMTDFIKEIRDNYATKKELNEVKEKICVEEEWEITKEITSMTNKRLIWVVIIQWIVAIVVWLIWVVK